MQEPLPVQPQPFFLPTPKGRLFAVYHRPTLPLTCRGNVLVVPAFNEEMNRCRSMVTLQAQSLGKLGWGTLVLDLHGTGESDGDYVDARWDLWLGNIQQAVAWLDEQPGRCTGLLAVRLGVALALAFLRQDQKQRALVAWQPIVNGKTYFTQFMRTRIAANMDRNDIPKETSVTMRAQLAQGQSVEVTGYEIHPELASMLDQLDISDLQPSPSVSMAWFEKGSGADKALAPTSQSLLASWQQNGSVVDTLALDGPAFWALHDRAVAPAWVEHTSVWFQKLSPTL